MLPGRSGWAGLCALALLASGCLSSSGPTAVSPNAALPKLPVVPGAPIVQDHDHADMSLHLDRFAMEPVALATGYDGPTPAGVFYTEEDFKDGWAYVCRGGGQPGIGPLGASLGGFVIVNVSDPRNPLPVGQQEGVPCSDIKVNDANDLVFYATQRNAWYDIVANPAAPQEKLPRGVYLVNVADKAHPSVERFMPIPLNGVHTINYVNTGSRELLLVQTYDWMPDSGLVAGFPVPFPSTGQVNPALQRSQIFEVTRAADGKRDLQLLSVFSMHDVAPQGVNYFPHDVTVQKHPITGDWLAYYAYWDLGMVIVNINDPANPKLVSVFDDTTPSAYVHLHQARPFPHLIDGKHITVTEPELPSAAESGQFTIVDTTDPAHPVKLGYWTLPGNLVIPGGFLFSPHNFNLANGRIYAANYHAGIWVVDVGSPEHLAHPEAVGFFQADHRNRAAEDCGIADSFWSAFYVDGYVYGTDGCAGLTILQFQGDKGLEGKGPRVVMETVGQE